MVFVWVNREKPTIWLLGFGLHLKFVAISFNGGWMPISPETLESQYVSAALWGIGSRLGSSKDIVLEKKNITLWNLLDILTLPKWILYRVAFSIGDVLIALGIVGLLLQNEISEQKEGDDHLR